MLGAGASYDAGGPLVRDFFSRDSERSASIHRQYFDGIGKFEIMERMYRNWAQYETNPNVESFFKRVEFQNLIDRDFEDPLNGDVVKPETFLRQLVWYINAYVRNSVAFQRNPPGYYFDFARSLKRRGKRFSILTFNYDLVFERAIIDELGGVDYKLGKFRGDYTHSDGIPFLKLHGSLNWLWCRNCGRIDIFDKPVGHKYNRVACTRRCGGYKEPLIVPPNPNKELYLHVVYDLWKKADKLLSGADRIVIAGYSLPEIDASARELLLDHVRNTKRFDIINSSIDSFHSIARRLGRVSDTPLPTSFKDYVRTISD